MNVSVYTYNLELIVDNPSKHIKEHELREMCTYNVKSGTATLLTDW